ncbi:MAG: hypothetical protein K2P80_14500 [Beijerinckiaceae bacterium]|nr:hypothetical protein [Beijerinckiaceae bacterium]
MTHHNHKISIAINGDPHQVLRQDKHDVIVFSQQTGRAAVIPRSTLEKQYLDGTCVPAVMRSDASSSNDAVASVRIFDLKFHSEAKERREALEAAQRAATTAHPCKEDAETANEGEEIAPKFTRALLDTLHQETGNELFTRSVATFNRWWKNFQANGLLGLVPRYDLRGRGPRIEGDVEITLTVLIEDLVKGDDPADAIAVYHALKARFGFEPEDHFDACSISTVRRRIRDVCEAVLLESRSDEESKKLLVRKYGHAGHVCVPKGVGARVEMDSTQLKLKGAGGILTIVVTIAIDVFTRVILGIWVSIRPACVETSLMALRSMFLPKRDLIDRYGLRHDWPLLDGPFTLICDNGSEFRGHFPNAVSNLGGVVKPCIPYTPEHKPYVERFFRTLKASVARKVLRRAVTVEEATAAIHKAVDEYHAKEHKGLGMTPLKAWKAANGKAPLLPAKSRDEILIECSVAASHTIQKGGFKWNGVDYASDALFEAYKRHNGPYKATVYLNGEDRDQVFVRDDATQTALRVGKYRPARRSTAQATFARPAPLPTSEQPTDW